MEIVPSTVFDLPLFIENLCVQSSSIHIRHTQCYTAGNGGLELCNRLI